mmetsp:Transcript_11804/g.13559  ORF Transcript_11804/g.13559 Transcript_11804/m.13559 type:complete len:230 (+) Transcript_11804:26-715(+)
MIEINNLPDVPINNNNSLRMMLLSVVFLLLFLFSFTARADDTSTFVLGIHRRELCPMDSCWVPIYYENQPKLKNGGVCATRESYKKECTFEKEYCHFCIKDQYLDSSEGNCSADPIINVYDDGNANSVSLGSLSSNMVYPGLSGVWSIGTDESRVQSLLCDNYHKCRCGDLECLSSVGVTDPYCITISIDDKAKQSCCTSSNAFTVTKREISFLLSFIIIATTLTMQVL